MTVTVSTLTIQEWLFKWAMTNPREQAPAFYEGERATAVGNIVHPAELQTTWNKYHELFSDVPLEVKRAAAAMKSKSRQTRLPPSLQEYLAGIGVFVQYWRNNIVFQDAVEISNALSKTIVQHHKSFEKVLEEHLRQKVEDSSEEGIRRQMLGILKDHLADLFPGIWERVEHWACDGGCSHCFVNRRS